MLDFDFYYFDLLFSLVLAYFSHCRLTLSFAILIFSLTPFLICSLLLFVDPLDFSLYSDFSCSFSHLFSVQSLEICSKKKKVLVAAMVLDDRTADFLLQVRQAMVASGSSAASTPLPLEEVAAAVEASGFSSALNDMAAATLSSSVSIFNSLLIQFLP